MPVHDKDGFNKIITSTSGNYHATGKKWGDDTLVRSLWTSIIVNDRKISSNYTINKQYINCTGKYVDTSGDGNTSGFGEGSSKSEPSCNMGSMVLNENCKLVKTADIVGSCGSTYFGKSTITWNTSTPISLILDEKYDINANVSIVNFALDPNLNKTYWLWKASEKSPLLVYDPLHHGDVTSATQLFGNWTFGGQKVASLLGSAAPGIWKNGFEALETLDSNNDGVISNDELKPLALWFDKNQDGISQPGEVQDIISFGIKSLSVVPDKEDHVNKTIEATKGFIKEVDGQTSSGRLVDWSSEGSEFSALLISAKLLNNPDTIASANQNDNQYKNLIKSSGEENNSYGKNEGAASAATGVWRWKIKGEKDVEAKSGYFTIANNGSQINGHTITELLLGVNDGNTEQINHIVNFAKLSGTQELNSDGSISLKFSTPIDNSGVINNEAKIDSTGVEMAGSSDAEYEEAGIKKHLRYLWNAQKVIK